MKVAEHKDIDDDGQTVLITERIIKIHTIATDKDGKKEIEAGKDVTIVDTVKLEAVSYTHLDVYKRQKDARVKNIVVSEQALELDKILRKKFKENEEELVSALNDEEIACMQSCLLKMLHQKS